MRCSVFVIFVWLVFMFARRLGSPPYRMLRCRFYVRTRRKNVFHFKCLYINKISMFLNSLCKLLSIRCLTCSKIQAIYFKIQGTYFKICALCFLRDALCFFTVWGKVRKKSRISVGKRGSAEGKCDCLYRCSASFSGNRQADFTFRLRFLP